MLVLGRKEGQQIMLNHNVVIKIVSVQGNYVKVGIEAPDSVKVYREEVYLKLRPQDISHKQTCEDQPLLCIST